MPKKKSRKGIYIFLAIVILAIAGYGAFSGSFSVSGIGFDTLALSNIRIESSSSDLSGQQWVATIVQDGSGGFLEGTFTPQEVSDIYSGSESPQLPFTLKLEMTKNDVQYPINAISGTKLYEVNYYIMGIGGNRESRLAQCQSTDGGYDVFLTKGILADWVCLQRFEVGTFGQAGAGSNIFESVVTVQAQGKTPTSAKVNNVNSPSASLGSIGTVKWNGNLVSGQQIPTPSNEDVCFLNYKESGNWVFISCTNFNDYQTSYNDYASCGETKTQQFSTQGIEECKQDINRKLNTAQQFKSFKVSGGSQASVTGQLGSGVVTLPLAKQFQFPLMTLRLKVDYIGIVTPVGDPKIVSVSSDKFTTGGTGIITARIKNVGQALGSFDVSAICNSPFTSNDRTRITVNPGQETTAYLKVYGESGQLISGSCTVKAVDVNDARNFDEAQVTVSVDVVAECRDGVKEAVGKIVRECQNGKWIILSECGQGEIADAFSFECISTSGGSGSDIQLGGLEGLFDLFGGFANFIIVIAILFIIILALWLLIKISRRK